MTPLFAQRRAARSTLRAELRHELPLPSANPRKRLAYFINCFPNFIETMIYREVLALKALGYEVHTVSIRRPEAAAVPDEARDLAGTTHYILPVNPLGFALAHVRALVLHPIRYWRTLFRMLFGEHQRLTDRFRTLCHFAEGVAVAPVIKNMDVDHLHAHWAVGSASCAMVVSELNGTPFSFTAHAYDIWRDKLIIPEKLEAADLVLTCTDYNRRHLIDAYGADPSKVRVVYHGLDTGRFHPSRVDGASSRTILSVGRLVEQKGFDCLLRACAILADGGSEFVCEIVGDGPLRDELETLAAQLGITERVRFRGRLYQKDLINRYARADIFALPCMKAADDDRDGIPNTLIEAFAMELPVVSTRFSGIPEIVTHGENGLLVEAGDAGAFAASLDSLLSDAERRRSFGRAGRRRVLQEFTVQRSAELLDDVFTNLPRPA